MKTAIGIVELVGSANAIHVVDRMVKTADVQYLSKETVFGAGRVTVFVQGDVSAVTAAVDAVKNSDEYRAFSTYVIANPHPETQKFLKKSELKHAR